MTTFEKALIIRFSSIGDIVLASPLIRVLRTAYPDAVVDFLVKSEYAELVRYNPHLSSVIELHTAGRDELRSLRGIIRSKRYTVILDIHNGLRSRYLRMFSGAKRISAIDKRVIARFALVNLKKNIYPKSILSVAERYMETAKLLGIEDDDNGLEIFIPDHISSAVAAILSKHKLEKYEHVVALVPASKHFTKRWLPERFVELGIKLAASGSVKLLVFGGRNDIDYCSDIAQMINVQAGWTAAESLAGKFSLLETASAFDACNLVVSNDTGLMHLAVARKRKIVAIFGSTVREFGFFPYATANIVVERKGLYCRPCSHIGLPKCPEGHFRCMKEISSDDVLLAVRSLLHAVPAQPVTHEA